MCGERRYPENEAMNRATTKPEGGQVCDQGRRSGTVMATPAVCDPTTKEARVGMTIPKSSSDPRFVDMVSPARSRAGELATVLPKKTVPATVATTSQSMPCTTPSRNLLFTFASRACLAALRRRLLRRRTPRLQETDRASRARIKITRIGAADSRSDNAGGEASGLAASSAPEIVGSACANGDSIPNGALPVEPMPELPILGLAVEYQSGCRYDCDCRCNGARQQEGAVWQTRYLLSQEKGR